MTDAAFVGEDRHRLVDDLVQAFQQTRETRRNRLAVLAAPTGWGKTRVVQEFYSRLAQAPGGEYWPERLHSDDGSWLQTRKRIFPEPFSVPEESRIPFLWLGISCQKDQMGRELAALQYAEQQFGAHVGPLAAALESSGERWKARLGALGAVAGLFGLPDPVNFVMTWHGLASTGVKLVTGEWQAFTNRREGKTARTVDTTGAEREVTRAGELAEQIARISGQDLPVVIVVDDAHWADSGTVEFIDKLLATPGHVLVAATAWPDQLAVQAEDPGTFSHALAGWTAAGHAERHELGQLGDDALEQLIRSAAPDVPPRVLEALAERCDGNPNRLQGLLSLRVVRRALAASGGSLSEEQIAGLPTGDREIYAAIWRDLPENVRDVLALSTVQGHEFNPEWIPAAAGLLDLTDANHGLAEARSPWGWVRSLDTALDAFVESGLYERAEEERGSLFLPDELAKARAAMLEWAVAQKEREDWGELSTAARRAVLEAHFRGADDGFLPIDSAVLDSTGRLIDILRATNELQRAREVAERGLEWTAGKREFRGKELVFRHRLADTIGQLGDAADARERFRDLVEDAASFWGEDDFNTLYVRNDLAWWTADAGRPDEAVAEYERVLAQWRRTLGDDHRHTRTARRRLASALTEVGRFEEATSECRALLDEYLRTEGRDHPDTLSARSNLAQCLAEGGHIVEAVAELERLLEDRRRVLGDDHGATLATQSDLASWLLGAGRPGESLEMLEAALQARLQLFGADDPTTFPTRHNIGMALGQLRRHDEAIEVFEALLVDRERVLGPDHPSTLRTRNSLAAALDYAGRPEEAIEAHRKLVGDSERVLGPDHPESLTARHGLATSLAEAGDYDEAIDQFERILEDRVRIIGAEHPVTMITRNNLAFCYGRVGRRAEAGAEIVRVLEYRERTLGPEHPDTLISRRSRADWLVMAGHEAGDEERMREGVESFQALMADEERILGKDHPLAIDTRELLEYLTSELDL